MLLCGCSAKGTEEGQPHKSEKDKRSIVKINTNKTGFLGLFKEVVFDTLHIYFEYSPEGDIAIKGQEVPKEYLSYFSKEVKLGATEWNVSPVFACYKFQYSPEQTVLIANVPSEYDATAFNLYLFSDKEDKIIFSQKIAENTGDAGYVITQDSWLLDLDKDGLMDFVTKQVETIPEDEELTKFSYTNSISVYLGSEKSFKAVKAERFDTKGLKVHKTNI